LFDVDPLDQPGVEAGKDFTYALMGRPGFSDVRDDLEGWVRSVERRII
jgi:glucose-6-phosphate isomerase